MSTPMPRERLADVLARTYGDGPLSRLSVPAATPHYQAADACLAVLALYGEASGAVLRGTQSRIERALHEIAAFETDDVDVIRLLLRLVAVLDGPEPLSDPDLSLSPLTADLIRERMTETLIADWPRMAYAGHVGDVADSVMNVVLPITSRLREESSAWRVKAAHAIAQCERARATAVFLEQTSAEAARLLRADLPRQALAVLNSGSLDED